MSRALLFLIALSLGAPAIALEPIGDKTGFGGFVNIGISGGEISSNFFASVADLDIDFGDDTIDDLGAPSAEQIVLPSFAFELGYTFKNKKTRVFLGNDFADYLQFDRSTRFAIRHDFDKLGTLQLAYLKAALLATETWSDPYLTGTPRDTSDLDVAGVRFTWDRMFGSSFELKISTVEREIDDEQSGVSLPLTSEERQLLDRNGDVTRIELGYFFISGNRKHIVRPSVRYVDRDIDGRAMAQEGAAAEVTYVFQAANTMRWVTTVSYGEFDGDAVNPVFNKKNDSDRFTFASTLFMPGTFGLDKWTANIGVVWGREDTDIAFNETEMWLISAGVLRRF